MLRVFASAIALTVLCGAAAPHRPVEPAQGISPLDIIELQIGYTTILARYYKPVAPRVLVDGARTGIAADLVAHGIDDELPYTPARVTFYDGGDLIESLVFRSLARYGSRVGAHDLVQAALAGELSALKDPYSVLFFPQQFKKFNAFLGNEKIGGIGAVVSFVPASGEAHVDRVLPGSPAEKIGVQEDDAIVAIDGRSVAAIGGQGLRDALRGKIGTTVRIEIARAEAHLTFAIVRAEIHDPEVTVARFGDVGYLALSRFGDNAGSEITADLADLQAHGARAFILDLRGNGGGYGVHRFRPDLQHPRAQRRDDGFARLRKGEFPRPARRARRRRHGLRRRDRRGRRPRWRRRDDRGHADLRQRRRAIGLPLARRQRVQGHDCPVHNAEGPRHRPRRHRARRHRRRAGECEARRPGERPATEGSRRSLGFEDLIATQWS